MKESRRTYIVVVVDIGEVSGRAPGVRNRLSSIVGMCPYTRRNYDHMCFGIVFKMALIGSEVEVSISRESTWRNPGTKYIHPCVVL